MGATRDARQLRARSVAFVALARLLGPHTEALHDRQTIDALALALGAAGLDSAGRHLDAIAGDDLPDPAVLAGRWVRWFDLGRVAPYEGSNVVSSVGGVTPRLADVAGFYRAFNVEVRGDRPDHIVAQLEFLAVTMLMEAEAIEQGDAERGEIAAHATRTFLRDHLGGWVEAWAARVGEIDELSAWMHYAALAADLVGDEALLRNVIPLRTAAVLRADSGIAGDDEALLECSDAVGDSFAV